MELIALYALAVVIVAGLAFGLVLWAACAVSGRISREEDRNG